MDSSVVYQVIMALPKEEQLLVFENLKKDFEPNFNQIKKQSKSLLKSEAIDYLLKNVFTN